MEEKPLIYYAGPLSAGGDPALNARMIHYLKRKGNILTEHLSDPSLQGLGEKGDDKIIHDRDLLWLKTSDIVVAEVSTPSLGVGYEIANALAWKKKVICLFKSKGNKLSSMIAGNEGVDVINYSSFEDLIGKIDTVLPNTL